MLYIYICPNEFASVSRHTTSPSGVACRHKVMFCTNLFRTTVTNFLYPGPSNIFYHSSPTRSISHPSLWNMTDVTQAQVVLISGRVSMLYMCCCYAVAILVIANQFRVYTRLIKVVALWERWHGFVVVWICRSLLIDWRTQSFKTKCLGSNVPLAISKRYWVLDLLTYFAHILQDKPKTSEEDNCEFCSNRILPYFPMCVC